MSTKSRKCRRGLAAALDQAADEVPCGSSPSPNSVSSQNLVRISQNDDTCLFDHWTEKPDCMCLRCVLYSVLSVINAAVVLVIMFRPFSVNRKEDFLCYTRSVLRDLHGLLGQ